MTNPLTIHRADDITCLLRQWQSGDRDALDLVMTTLYDELKKIARCHLSQGRDGMTFTPTVLVNEACLKLIKHRPNPDRTWRARAEFYGLVSKVMLNLLTDYAKSKKSKKHGGNLVKMPFFQEPETVGGIDLLVLADVLKRLEKMDARQCGIWKCRYLCGLSIGEIADIFKMGQSSIHRELRAGMGWVRLKLERGTP